VNVGQTYCYEGESGDRVFLQSRLRELKLWHEMRLWHAMLAELLGSFGPAGRPASAAATRNRRQTLSMFRQVHSQ
jgi:hypothetical protein